MPQARPKKGGAGARALTRGAEHQDPRAGRGAWASLARFELTPGQAGDVKRAADLLEGLPVQTVMADTAYDAAHLIDPLHERGVTTVILSPCSAPFGFKSDRLLVRSDVHWDTARTECTLE